jgi:argininosuccinate lyase
MAEGKELTELSTTDLKNYSDKIGDDVMSALELDHVLSAKSVTGGTSPKQVAAALKSAKKYLQTK